VVEYTPTGLTVSRGVASSPHSCLIEAYDGPEKYGTVCDGLLANHVFNLNSFFHSIGAQVAADTMDVFRC
jgi:hypothetical protein